ncbi:hypothetical protein [Paenibacillus marchantiophytorum]|uniref:hypothetical protein n=1 Tax=Paenibacillus marchantiophytorum TaxID=1619310 RepID=UPI001664449A|nr:hypothetical protein [Paenibacillus marchantiophytorum]
MKSCACFFQQPNRISIRCEDTLVAGIELECQRLITECAESRIGKNQAIRATLNRMLVDVLRACPADPKALFTHSRVDVPEWTQLRKALHYIDYHFREPITLHQAAALTPRSPNYFSENSAKLSVSRSSSICKRRGFNLPIGCCLIPVYR